MKNNPEASRLDTAPAHVWSMEELKKPQSPAVSGELPLRLRNPQEPSELVDSPLNDARTDGTLVAMIAGARKPMTTAERSQIHQYLAVEHPNLPIPEFNLTITRVMHDELSRKREQQYGQ